jgi:hypothetical protein
VAVALIAVALFSSVGRPAASGSAAPAKAPGASSLTTDQRKANQLVQTLGVTEMLGPLAPVALSPFFSLAVLSGASLAGPYLAESNIPVLDSIGKNALLGSNSPLNNGFVFSGLLGLTVLTSLPKLTKLTKPLAQAVDQIEAHAGIISVVAVQALSQIRLGETEPEQVTLLVQAGIFSFSVSTLIAVFSAINIFVINTVKFLFEMLIWISPIPAVDAFFEAANKAFATFLLGVYLVSPWLATGINLIIFAISLMIFAWAHRRVVYMRSICGDPVLGWIGEKVFRRPPVTTTSTVLPSSIAGRLPNATLVLKAFSGKAYQGLKRKSRGYLVQSGGRLHFAKPRFLRSPLVVTLPSEGHRVRVDKGLLSNTVRIEDDAGETAVKILITRRYNGILEAIRSLVGASLVAGQPAGREKVMDVTRSIGAAIKGESRDALRAELA